MRVTYDESLINDDDSAMRTVDVNMIYAVAAFQTSARILSLRDGSTRAPGFSSRDRRAEVDDRRSWFEPIVEIRAAHVSAVPPRGVCRTL